MRRGVRPATDGGAVRIGVAAGAPDGTWATPVATVQRDAPDVAPSLSRLAEIIAEREPIVLYVGLPRTLKGKEGPAATAAREFAHALLPRVTVPIQLVDERLTTVVAHQALHRSGRKMKSHRSVRSEERRVGK